MHSFYLLAFFAAVTGQVLALNIQLGAPLGNITAGELLAFGSSDSFVSQANCTTPCDSATSILQQCGTDDTCTCKNETGAAILACEQCLYNEIVDLNIPAPNPLMGSQPALGAFVAACLAPPVNTTVQALKLTVPPSFHGPQSNHLGTVATAVAVSAAAILGGSFLFMFSTLE